MKAIKLATFNFNGIRSRLPHLLQWLEKESPDIACHDGTRVTLRIFINPKHWPGTVAEGIFSSERMAQAVLGLEKAALKSAP